MSVRRVCNINIFSLEQSYLPYLETDYGWSYHNSQLKFPLPGETDDEKTCVICSGRPSKPLIFIIIFFHLTLVIIHRDKFRMKISSRIMIHNYVFSHGKKLYETELKNNDQFGYLYE